jgi:cobalamin biosynthesis Mg chelatase CobN
MRKDTARRLCPPRSSSSSEMRFLTHALQATSSAVSAVTRRRPPPSHQARDESVSSHAAPGVATLPILSSSSMAESCAALSSNQRAASHTRSYSGDPYHVALRAQQIQRRKRERRTACRRVSRTVSGWIFLLAAVWLLSWFVRRRTFLHLDNSVTLVSKVGESQTQQLHPQPQRSLPGTNTSLR